MSFEIIEILYASRVPTSPDMVKANPRPETPNPKLRNTLNEHLTNRNGNGVWFISGLRSEAFLKRLVFEVAFLFGFAKHSSPFCITLWLPKSI